MTIFINTIMESNLGYAAIFACMGVGFLFMRKVDAGQPGPGYWAVSFFFNSLGFLLWSGKVPIPMILYYFLGEVFHVTGFLLLACGVYRFSGRAYRPGFFMAMLSWIVVWIASIALLRSRYYPAALMLKVLRAALFIAAGIVIVDKRTQGSSFGKRVTGFSLIVWGLYTILMGFVRIEYFLNLAYGFLVGFQILSAFGMVAMVVDRIKIRAERSERRAKSLEGLLPICSYCKKIRDEKNEWHTLELYIEERSKAEFSHGICPECFQKHRPDR